MPAAILGLLAGIAAYFALALFDRDLLQLDGNPLVIGPIEASGSIVEAVEARAASLAAVQLADVALILVSALTLSVLLSIDTLKTGVVLDALTRRRHDSNRELIGQGAANAAAFFVGGMPGAGTMGATLVNFTSGGRTPWSGVAEGVLVVLAFVLLGRLIAWVPIGALAGLLLVVAWRMFDRGMFRLALKRSTRIDFVVIATVVGRRPDRADRGLGGRHLPRDPALHPRPDPRFGDREQGRLSAARAPSAGASSPRPKSSTSTATRPWSCNCRATCFSAPPINCSRNSSRTSRRGATC